MAETADSEGARAALDDFLNTVPGRLKADREAALGALGTVEGLVGRWEATDLIYGTNSVGETVAAICEAQAKLARFATTLRFGSALGDAAGEALPEVDPATSHRFINDVEARDATA